MTEDGIQEVEVSFPYIPGLLAFREGPVVVAAFEKLKTVPDLVIFDAQGLAHPRRLGLASHLGLLTAIGFVLKCCRGYRLPEPSSQIPPTCFRF